MKPGVLELRWAYVVFVLLVALDTLIVSRAAYVLNHRGTQPIAVEAPYVLLIMVGLQALLVWLFLRLRKIVRYYRRLQESYEQELDLTRQVMEGIGQGVTVADDNGRFVYVNQAYADLLGLQPQDIVGRTAFDFTVEDDHVNLTRAREKRARGESSLFMSRLRRADGRLMSVQVMVTPRWHHGRNVGSIASVMPWRWRGSGVEDAGGLAQPAWVNEASSEPETP